MNRGLERGPLSVARRGLYSSGQRLDPLAGSATMDSDSQVSWGTRRAHPFWLSRQGSNGACITMLAVLPEEEHPLPACTQGPIGPRVGRPAWETHEFSSRDFPDSRAERMQRLGSMRKLS
jgi:hypothetical protein